MKNLLLKAANVFFMIMFWVSFFTFCYPIVMELNGQFAVNLFSFGILGTMVFITAWAFSLDCWLNNSKN